MGAESHIRQRITKLLRDHRFYAMAVENSACPGTPDVHYSLMGAGGWIELKQIEAWPRLRDGIVQVKHFRPEQRIWLRNYCQRGGRAFLLMRVDTDWILLWGEFAADHLGKCAKAFLTDNALGWWPGRLHEEGLLSCLTTRLPT